MNLKLTKDAAVEKHLKMCVDKGTFKFPPELVCLKLHTDLVAFVQIDCSLHSRLFGSNRRTCLVPLASSIRSSIRVFTGLYGVRMLNDFLFNFYQWLLHNLRIYFIIGFVLCLQRHETAQFICKMDHLAFGHV